MWNFLAGISDITNQIGLFFGQKSGSLNWLAKVIQWIIGLVGNVGLGIILFTVVLKLITLPLDVYSKASMRKNSLKMEKMRPQLEKLQKQYQNDQQTYNMKMMELYKKNGYSMFGACLPMIVTLVVFIFVLNAFTSYSNYTNVNVYKKMADAYSVAIVDTFAPENISGTEYSFTEQDGKNGKVYIVTRTEYYSDSEALLEYEVRTVVETSDSAKKDQLMGGEGWENEKSAKSTSYYYVQTDRVVAPLLSFAPTSSTEKKECLPLEDGKFNAVRTVSYGSESDLVSYSFVYAKAQSESDPDLVDWNAQGFTKTGYIAVNEELAKAENAFGENETAKELADIVLSYGDTEVTDKMVAEEFIREEGREAAADYYKKNKIGFLWVKNIWQPDTSFKHPVQRESGVDKTIYNEITKNLSYWKNTANGYYILIVISIGTMFLSQFILSKSQKAQNELQTADGRGQKTQKVMMIVMPIIFGIFSFFYSAAFSIYMITSNIFGIISTLCINLVIDAKFRKIEEKEIQEKYNKRIPQAVRNTNENAKRNGGKKK